MSRTTLLRVWLHVLALSSAIVLLGAGGTAEAQETPAAPEFGIPEGEPVVPGEVIVKFKTLLEGATASIEGAGRPEAVSDDTFVFRLDAPALETISAEQQMSDALAALNERDDVVWAEPNYWAYPLDTTPNDNRYSEQWHYFSNGTGTSESPGGVDLPKAWDGSTGNTSVVVAVIDTGILPSHPEFVGANLLNGFDMISIASVENDSDPGRDDDETDPGDAVAAGECGLGRPARGDSWHGSHVAGTVGAGNTNDANGIAGVAWQVGVLPVRVLGKCGGATSDIAAAIRWAAGLTVPGVRANTTPARVLNLSLGGRGSCSNTYRDAIAAANAAGAAVVVAAGNETEDAGDHRPASCAAAITVGAVDSDGGIARYSNFGASVDVMGPGGDVFKTTATGGNGGVLSVVNGGYAFYNGTSMATPHVAGLLALWLAQDSSLTPAQLATEATTNVRPLGAAQGCSGNRCGAGLITAVRGGPPAPPQPPPSCSCGLVGIELALVPLITRLLGRRRFTFGRG